MIKFRSGIASGMRNLAYNPKRKEKRPLTTPAGAPPQPGLARRDAGAARLRSHRSRLCDPSPAVTFPPTASPATHGSVDDLLDRGVDCKGCAQFLQRTAGTAPLVWHGVDAQHV
jgi:hypothetical protein